MTTRISCNHRYVVMDLDTGTFCHLDRKWRRQVIKKARNHGKKLELKTKRIFPKPKHWMHIVQRPNDPLPWPSCAEANPRSRSYSPFPFAFPYGTVFLASDFVPDKNLKGPCLSIYCSAPAPYFCGRTGRQPFCWKHLYEDIFHTPPPSNCTCSLNVTFERPKNKCLGCLRWSQDSFTTSPINIRACSPSPVFTSIESSPDHHPPHTPKEQEDDLPITENDCPLSPSEEDPQNLSIHESTPTQENYNELYPFQKSVKSTSI
jgi:hypothetical protein